MRQYSARVAIRDRGVVIAPLVLRQLFPILLFMAALWLLRDRLPQIRPAEVLTAAREIGTLNWLGAGVATLISFAAIGRYDRIIHTILRTGTAAAEARHSGIVAVAISQFAGFGLITGTIARWRMLPSASMADAARITAFVSGSFIAGWAFIAATCDLLLGGTVLPLWADLAILTAGLCLLALPSISMAWPRACPGSLTMLQIAGAVAVDLGFAALAFYLLLPEGADIAFAPFLTAFVFAMMAGLVCGTPGGIGALELTLIAYLPHTEGTDLLSAALAFRLIYHAIPAVLAGIALVAGPRETDRRTPGWVQMSDRQSAAMAQNSAFAEAGLVRQGDMQVWAAPGRVCALAGELPQSLCAFSRPVAGPDRAFPDAIRDLARTRDKVALIYRATPRIAAQARRQGWAVICCGHEAIVEADRYHPELPRYRQLRRLLRKAEAAGLAVEILRPGLHRPELTRIATDWARAHGGERGFVMGRFDPDYLDDQIVLLARVDGRPVAFVSLHVGRNGWALDLMRHETDVPAGTMQALVHAAICQARATGVATVSLAGIPSIPTSAPALISPLVRRFDARAGSAGLFRFKDAFAPDWQPRYAASPTWPGLVVAFWDVMRATAPHEFTKNS